MPSHSQGQTRRIGDLRLLLPAPRSPAVPLGACLTQLEDTWKRDGSLVALWRSWPRIAGPQLAPHCRPLNLQAGVLSVGAGHPQWLQALRYNRHQLLGALRAAGFTVRDVRFQQFYPPPQARPGTETEAAAWAAHPSRVDVHGLMTCPACGSPAPAGELARWGHCSFCVRSGISRTQVGS